MIGIDEIPGYREAIDRERNVRENAFLGLRERICGFPVEPITLRHLIILRGIESPFVNGGECNKAECARFLWVMRPGFVANPPGPFRRWLHCQQVRRKSLLDLVPGIHGFIDGQFQDAPGTSQAGYRVQYYSEAAGCVDLLASAYHWTEECILGMPMPRLLQYSKVIMRRLDPQTPLFNPSDRVRGEWMRRRACQK